MLTGTKHQSCNPEIWGGIECTINRIQDRFMDQLRCSGHYSREGDIKLFAETGISALRYPVLWEHHQPQEDQIINWNWITQQLTDIRNRNIVPIAGLVHHGSGPVYTDMLQDSFVTGLANYAYKVAVQFPWLEYYTPINEPLTTARFSGLYGHWYPHHKNAQSFGRMLVNELKAVVLAMKEIRKINPAAKLVQTEDLSKTYSTEILRYQALFENERRWLTYDLLCGKVDNNHYLWNYLTRCAGLNDHDLAFFREHICIPDIMGLNYYITSERFLDDRIHLYPEHTHGSNEKHRYADVEAIRVAHDHPWGIELLLKEAWERYHIPVALTEVHINCGREHQLRWFKEVWDAACKLKHEGVDVRAVTGWSLLGSFDWNSLLTRDEGHYEPGIFDVRYKRPKRTAVGKMIRSLTDSKEYEHPLILQPGWWKRSDRFMNPACSHSNESSGGAAAPLMVVGKNGTLATAFAKICEQRHIHYKALSRSEMDATNERQVEQMVELHKPWGIINASGYVRVDEAEDHSAECFSLNTIAPALLAKVCKKYGLPFMTFSTDLVFNGEKNLPYTELDLTEPLNVYGKSKANGETQVMAQYDSSLIIRTSAFFGPWDKYNYAYHILNSLQQRQSCEVVDDVFVSPTYVPDLVNVTLDLFIDEEKGIWHVCNDGVISWADFACEIAERGGYQKQQLWPKGISEMQWKAARPLYSALKSDRGIQLPKLSSAMHRFFSEKIY